MRHKTEKIKKEMAEYTSEYPIEQGKLFRYLNIIDNLCQLLGFGEITITDYLRDNPNSLHSLGLAGDIRVRDKPALMYLFLHTICKAIESVDRRLRTNFHYDIYGKPNQHIHVEVRYR